MNLTNQEAEIVNTTISYLRKNFSEGDFDLWQERLKVGFMKVTSRSVGNFGFLGENLNGSSVNVQHEVAHLIVSRRVDLL